VGRVRTVRSAAARGKRGSGSGHAIGIAIGLLGTLVRALGLRRAALFLEDAPGRPLRRVAAHGAVTLDVLSQGESPGDEPWTAVLPVRASDRTVGLLLIERDGGAQLGEEEESLAAGVADAVGLAMEHTRQSSDLERSRELLAHADRLSALGTLAAGVAHEIRNPLVSVRTFIQLLPEREHDEEFRTTFRELALSEIERICGLINDLLAFSRPAPAQVEPTDLNDVVGQIVRLLDAEARGRAIELTCVTDPTLPRVVVDSGQVKQVLMNVILNAIQACGPRGQVQVTTRLDDSGPGRSCVVTIADSGAGIPPDQLTQVFDPFFTTKDAGSGLGLFIARRIVTEHGGEIAIAAREGGGTVFHIQFPMSLERGDDAHAG